MVLHGSSSVPCPMCGGGVSVAELGTHLVEAHIGDGDWAGAWLCSDKCGFKYPIHCALEAASEAAIVRHCLILGHSGLEIRFRNHASLLASLIDKAQRETPALHPKKTSSALQLTENSDRALDSWSSQNSALQLTETRRRALDHWPKSKEFQTAISNSLEWPTNDSLDWNTPHTEEYYQPVTRKRQRSYSPNPNPFSPTELSSLSPTQSDRWKSAVTEEAFSRTPEADLITSDYSPVRSKSRTPMESGNSEEMSPVPLIRLPPTPRKERLKEAKGASKRVENGPRRMAMKCRGCESILEPNASATSQVRTVLLKHVLSRKHGALPQNLYSCRLCPHRSLTESNARAHAAKSHQELDKECIQFLGTNATVMDEIRLNFPDVFDQCPTLRKLLTDSITPYL